LQKAVSSGARHPMDVKFELARTITADFHGADAAAPAEAHFRTVHQRMETPDEVAEIRLPASPTSAQLVKVLVDAALAPSNSEARRLLQQGGVRLDGEVVTDPFATVAAAASCSYLVKVGKRRFARITFSSAPGSR
jgi:tyrosyl-tRNA synthetase